MGLQSGLCCTLALCKMLVYSCVLSEKRQSTSTLRMGGSPWIYHNSQPVVYQLTPCWDCEVVA